MNEKEIGYVSKFFGRISVAAIEITSLEINVGDTIKEGDVLCIIEAMKLFNEIESEVSGKIVKILVDDANPVEFDEPLFIVDPS